MKRFNFILLLTTFLISLLMLGCGKNNNEDFKDTLNNGGNKEQKVKFVTSFYPMYVMMLNITDGADNVSVLNMSDNHVGCLHDFQIQTEDLKNIESSTAFIINGAGMEEFLDKVFEENPNINIIDSSKGIELLPSYSADGEDEENTHGNHEHHDDEYNPHIWLSIPNYIRQLDNITSEIIKLDSHNSTIYRSNCENYKKRLMELNDYMHEKIDILPNKNIVTFHDAFPYFAKDFSLNVISVINRSPHSDPSAKEITETVNLIKENNVKAVFVEPQYSDLVARNISSETDVKISVLDPAVTGKPDKNEYIVIMKKNLQSLIDSLS